MRSTRRLLLLATLLTPIACAARTDADASERFDLITQAEMQKYGRYSNLYDVIEVLRPRWLRPQGGGDTFMGAEGRVQIHMDGVRLGGVSVLHSFSPVGVTSISWLRPLEASSRYGFDHSHGAIIISTSPVP
ncbi:MAG TPA: hypothetical protein VMM83_07785 [Longimicrobiales bacterium]|nr:hypothetical protein [Longimicrobiales bacterium]